MKTITFTDIAQVIPGLRPPRPASEVIPDWYKKMPSYIGDSIGAERGKKITLDSEGKVSVPQTMKRCMPLFDAMTAGYIIETLSDVQVTQEHGVPYYIWSQNYEVITWHGPKQAEGNPSVKENVAPPKWTNPWGIKTPPGYSCLFLPPLNHHNGIFEVFSGVVDTDTYPDRVHFPFRLLDWEWEGVIPAGTPMVQVIPFKRDDFRMEFGGDDERKEANAVEGRLRQFFYNAYRNHAWSRKSYK